MIKILLSNERQSFVVELVAAIAFCADAAALLVLASRFHVFFYQFLFEDCELEVWYLLW